MTEQISAPVVAGLRPGSTAPSSGRRSGSRVSQTSRRGLAAMADDRALPEAIPADARDPGAADGTPRPAPRGSVEELPCRARDDLAAVARRGRARESRGRGSPRQTLAARIRLPVRVRGPAGDVFSPTSTNPPSATGSCARASRGGRSSFATSLDGADPQPGTALGELDYDLRLEHLGCVVSGPDAEIAVRALAREPRRRPPAGGPRSRARRAGRGSGGSARSGSLSGSRFPRGRPLSIGDPASGTAGFRSSHRQARGRAQGRGPRPARRR